MQLIRRLRIPALFCALAVLLCAILSRPFTNTGVWDDGPYILMAHTLANTGHVVYNGWAIPMLGWQLYLGAAFIKLFGFSFTTVRMSTLLVSMLLAFLLQRTLVRAGINERNSMLGTLALVLSPLYLVLTASYMSDLFGMFAIILCLYGCLRALEAAKSIGARPVELTDDGSAHPADEPAVILWLCLAAISNAILGTARQFAWMGTLIIVPCTLFLLHGLLPQRSRRRVLTVGISACLAADVFIFACMQWLKGQPFTIPDNLPPLATISLNYILVRFAYSLLDVSFFLLPITLLFLPRIPAICASPRTRKAGPLVLAILCLGLFLAFPHPKSLACWLIGRHPTHSHNLLLLLPAAPDWGDWFPINGLWSPIMNSTPGAFLGTALQVAVSLFCMGGLVALLASMLLSSMRRYSSFAVLDPSSSGSPEITPSAALTGRQLLVLIGPLMAAYDLFLVVLLRIAKDRYLFLLAPFALLATLRLYQDYIRPRLPSVAWVLITIVAAFSATVTHNGFTLYRAIDRLSAEVRAAGIPDTAVDYGWPYNLGTELRHASHLNDSRIIRPAHTYVSVPAPTCLVALYSALPHVRPLYSVSFNPNICYGSAPFAPVHYSRWPYRTPGTLYVVRYVPPSQLPHGMP